MELTVTKRDIKLKPKALRGKGLLPAVVYGRSEESTPITVDHKAFEKLFKAAGESTVITLSGLGENKDALINEVVVDPVTGVTIHADFYAIEKGQTVTVAIPIEFDGESPAVRDKGGILVKVMHELEVTCQPKDLPHSFHVDVSKLIELEDQIKVKDLAIPAAATISIDLDEVIAMIDVAKEEPVEEVVADISAIEISEERGKSPEEGEPGAAPGAPEAKQKEAKKE